MKPAKKFIFTLAIVLTAATLSGCSKSSNDKPADAPEKIEAQNKAGVTLDTETQARLGLKIEMPVAMQWQPEMKGYGRVIDPATLAAAVADLESARATAEASGKEYERQETLAAQDNVSSRSLETAKASSTHDELAFESALAKFKLEWGQALAENGDRKKMLSQFITGGSGLVRIDLPAGETLQSPPASARIIPLTDETKPLAGEFFSATDGVNPQTQSQSFFFLVKNHSPLTGSAATGFMKLSGETISGVVVPSSAILRHEGKGWVYLQTETNQFVRREIPLDRLTDNGWFVSETISATNRVVVSGAQAILSAELSGGGFNTGERD